MSDDDVLYAASDCFYSAHMPVARFSTAILAPKDAWNSF